MKIETTRELTGEQKKALLQLWNNEYPVKLQMPDITAFDLFLNSLVAPNHYLLLTDGHIIVGWANKYHIDDTTCFFIMIACHIHGKGYGTILLNELKKDEMQICGWAIDHDNDVKANGRPYPSPISFYLKNGFTSTKVCGWKMSN